jgi:predicted dehydrogenase
VVEAPPHGLEDVTVHAIGDLFPEAARARAEEHGVPRHGGIDAVLGDPDVEIVVNLTIPAAHVEVSLAAISAGKHVWSEKPVALDREGGRQLIAAADAAGVRLGCAPDTVLGAGLQASLKALSRGDIGTPLTALTLMQSPGPESWHPNPAFLFQTGAGPLFDIGPYYLTALVQAFGPVASVAAIGSRSREQRVIGSGPRAGESFDVTVPTHVSAIARFRSGQSSQSTFSFDSPLDRHGFVEITGTDATLALPDPNTFDGDVKIRRRDSEDWEVLTSTTASSTRGTGVLEMARAVRAGRPHRVQGALAHHVVDVMVSIAESAETGAFVPVTSTVEAAAPLPDDWDPFAATV